jgi:hypothetical protein
MSPPAKSDRRRYHPTPMQWSWWRVTLREIARSFAEPREVTPAECRAEFADRDAAMRAALREVNR